ESMFLFKLDPDGNVLCSTVLTDAGDDQCAVAIDGSGNCFLSGDFADYNPFIVGSDTFQLTCLENFFIAKFNCEPLGVSEINSDVINLFPNPVQNLLTISLPAKASNAMLHVYDLQGKMINLPSTIQNST